MAAKPNTNPKKNPMPTQPPKERAKNFFEVATGYSEETAIDEALRCLNCKNMPCVGGCPVKIHIPAFIEKVKEGDFEKAYDIIAESSSSCCLRQSLPAGNAMRSKMCARN